jgi:adenosylcobinamide-GDP ribazoletransferase
VSEDEATPDTRWLAPAPLRSIRAAFVFLTRIPVGGFPYRKQDWAWASAHFPLVGLVLGAILAAVQAGLLRGLDGLSASLLTIGASMMLTGAFHEDGLADTSDALGGAYDREKLFEILKDSRVGTFGAAALVVSIAARASLLARLGPSALWALPLIGCVARVGPIWLMRALPYATPQGSKSRDVVRGGTTQALVATAWGAAACGAFAAAGLVSPQRLAVLGAALLAVTVISGARYHVRAGGIAGDFLGATEQLGEVAGLATLAWGLT